jgi:hypothetical protein
MMTIGYRCALLCISVLLVSAAAGAQEPPEFQGVPPPAVAMDPTSVEFDPSPDHSLWDPSGQPIVSRYDLEFYYVGAPQPFQVTNLGKPAPEADGKIRVPFLGYITAWPPPGIMYEARVNTIGVSGTTNSAPSNEFMYSTGSCEYMLNPTMNLRGLSFPPSGGAGQATVLTGASCGWHAASSAPWLVVTSGPVTGNGVLTFTVAGNTGGARAATITLGASSIDVSQAAFTDSPGVQPARNASTAPAEQTDTIVAAPNSTYGSADSGAASAPPAIKVETAVANSVQQPNVGNNRQSFTSSPPERKADSGVAAAAITSSVRRIPFQSAKPDTSSGVQPVVSAPMRATPMPGKASEGQRVTELAISPASVAPGAAVTITLPAEFARRGGWIGLYAAGSDIGDAYVRIQYIERTTSAEGSGARTIVFAMPAICGQYTFRLLADHAQVVAASGVIIVSDPARTARD